jgi:hypothetical protein
MWPFAVQHVDCFQQKVANAVIGKYCSAQAHRLGLIYSLVFNVSFECKDANLMKSDAEGLHIHISDKKELAEEL